MTIQEVETLLERLTEQKVSSAYLQVIKPLGWRPSGFKMRTAFGLAYILNVTDRCESEGDYTSVAVIVQRKGIERWLTKARRS